LKKVVLISVGQPSTNPRLIKEANALEKAGFDVYVVYSYWTRWAYEDDKLIFSKARWTPILAGGSPFEHQLNYHFTRLRVKLFMFLAEHVSLKFGIAEIARGRAYPELLKKAKAIKADLYIAHIQAALPAAVNAAKKNNTKCGFDAEDFHRNEVNNDTNSYIYKISKFIEDAYLPKLDYFTTASPAISRAYKKLYPGLKITTINNVFESDQRFKISSHDDKKISIFWFSQTIGDNRGLDDVIGALNLLEDHLFELHLLGDATEEVKSEFNALMNNRPNSLYFHRPIPPDEVIKFASRFDIGLALENNVPLNRDICLTNKLFTYIQAGLAVIASDTTAQTEFMDQYPTIGKLYEGGNARSLADVLLYYSQNSDKLLKTRKAALELAHDQLNWETESLKFLGIVKETLSSN
jgi:glycosyltransferase involved in cell wall biosynthesis